MAELLEIRLLGAEPEVFYGGTKLSISRTDSLDLLVYLAEEGKENHDRARLAAVLFEDEASAEKLRLAIYYLRKALKNRFLPRESQQESKRLHFTRQDIRLDTDDFARRANELLSGRRDPNAEIPFAEAALDTLARYKTHFLQDYFFVSAELTEWRNQRQHTLAELRERLLDQLVRFYIQQGALLEAQQQAETWLNTSLEPRFMPLQYLIWIAVSRSQLAGAQQYMARLQHFEKNSETFFGPTVAEWKARILDANELPPSLLNIPLMKTSQDDTPILADFIERPELSRAFADLLVSDARLDIIGLTGLPGAGKSVFTRNAIAALRRKNPRFESVWVDLNEESDIEGLLNDVLTQLDLHMLLPLDYTNKQRRFKQMLKPRSCIIVLDENVSHKFAVPEFLETVTGLFDGARLVLIARALPETRFFTFDVPGFDQPDMEGFLQRHLSGEIANLHRVEPAWFEKLAAITGGLPLALNLVTGFILEKRYTLASLIREMSRGTHEWTPENAPILYQRLLDWSRNNVTPDEKTVLYAVAMFNPSNGCHHADLTALLGTACAMAEKRVDQLIERLANLHLLMIHQDGESARYRLHPIVYNYVQSAYRNSDTGIPFQALRVGYNAQMAAYAAANTGDFLRLDRYRHEIVGMFESVLSDPESPQAQAESVRLFTGLYDYFDQRGLYGTSERLLSMALDVTKEDAPERVYLLCCAGQSAFKRGQMDEAFELLKDAWRLAQRFEATTARSLILRDLGRIEYLRGDFETALDYLQRGQAAAAQDGQTVIQAQIMANLGRVNIDKERPQVAREWFSRITDELEPATGSASHGLQDVLQFVETQLGLLSMEELAFDAAETHFQKALAQARALNNPERIARSHLNLGVLCYTRRDFDAAWDYFTRGNVVANHIQNLELLSWFMWNKGVLKIISGDYKAAGRMLRTALGQVNDLGIRNTVPLILIWVGVMHLCQAQTQRAMQYFVEVFKQAVLTTRFAALALYGMALVTRYEQDLTLRDDYETARRQIYEMLAAHRVDTLPLPPVSRRDLESAQLHFQTALVEIPELERFKIVDALTDWCAAFVGVREG